MNQIEITPGKLVAGFATHTGQGKTANEDHGWLPQQVPAKQVAHKGRLYIVADGVGGNKAGEIASQLAIQTISRNYYADPELDIATALRDAINAANVEIYAQAQQEAYHGMGSTVVAAVIRGHELVVAHVGDSRAYLWQAGTLKQLTTDHTWVAARVTLGVLTPEEAKRHELRHVITRALGNKPEVEADIASFQFSPTERLLLACDGVWEPLEDQDLEQVLSRARPQLAAEILVQRAVKAGSTDDTTALVVTSETATMSMKGYLRETLLRVGSFPIAWVGIGVLSILLLFLIIGSAGKFIHSVFVPPSMGSCTNVVLNGGFETDAAWKFKRLANYSTEAVHSGTSSLMLTTPESLGDFSWGTQQIKVPNGESVELGFWVKKGEGYTAVGLPYRMFLRPEIGDKMVELDLWGEMEEGWHHRKINLSNYREQKISLYFSARNIAGNVAVIYVDDVELLICP